MIWLVGWKGMLGREVLALLEARDIDHVATDLELDITDRAAVLAHAKDCTPKWILNCAAYTAVDSAESEEDAAYAVNALGPMHLAEAAQEVGGRLLHVSTDYVFDGTATTPYAEDAATNPLGAYGRSKEAGERSIREACARHAIVRTAWLHGPHGPNFVATMLRLLAERPELKVVEDQYGSPTYAADLAAALLAFVEGTSATYGTYHYANDGQCTWHAFAEAIQARALELGLLETAIPIHPIPTVEFPTPAPRPAWSVLALSKIRQTFGLTIPSWQDGLDRHLQRLTPQE